MPEDQQNGEITGYSIQVEGPDNTLNIQIAATVSGRVLPIRRPHSIMEDVYTSEEVSDLRPSTEYSFSVSAKTVAGSGPAISVSFVMPQEGEASTHNTLIITSMFKLRTCSLLVWYGGVLINRFRRLVCAFFPH